MERKRKSMSRLALLTLAWVPLSVLALPSNEVTHTYYRDASKTQIVGIRILSCSGERVNWGSQTTFVKKTSERCAGGSRPGTSKPPCDFQDSNENCLNLPTKRPYESTINR